jgi:hypothetical protein
MVDWLGDIDEDLLCMYDIRSRWGRRRATRRALVNIDRYQI